MLRIKPFKIYLLICSFLCSIITSNIGVEGLNFLFLLPLCYGLCFYFILPPNLRLNSGLLILFLVLSFRYLLYPVLLVNNYQPILKIAEYGDQAVFFMTLEIFTIFITISRVCRNQSMHLIALQKTVFNPYLVAVLGLLSLMFIATGNSFMTGKHFVWQTDSIMSESDRLSGVASQLFSWFEAFLILFFVNKYAIKYFIRKKNLYFILSSIICFLPCIVYSGHSRLSLLIPLVCSCALLYKVFQEKARLPICISLGVGLIVITLLSIVKNLGNSGASSGADDLFSPTLMNAYFGGVENVVIGLRAYEKYGMNMFWFISDSLANAMGISKYFASMPGTISAFNNLFYGNIGIAYDQIVPTIVCGMMYFGKVFFFIPTIIMTYVVCKSDILFSKTVSIANAYLYSNFPVIVAWAIPGCWMHLTGRFFNFYIPILLLIYINTMLSNRHK